MDLQSLLQLGVAGVAVYLFAQLSFKQNKTINNHLDHLMQAQCEEAKSKMTLAKAIQKLTDKIDNLEN